MKNNPLLTQWGLLLIFILGFSACDKETTDLEYGIEPETQVDILCKSLRLLGNNIDGEMPSGTSGSSVFINTPSAVEISAGVLLFIPYEVSDINNICKVYMQVDGANNYWETDLTLEPISGKPFIEILIPKFVQDGDFDLVFSVGDCDGNISNVDRTQTIVSPLGDCGIEITGSVGLTVRAFDLGDKAGEVSISYNMYTIRDRLDIRYNGKWLDSTGETLTGNEPPPPCVGGSVIGETCCTGVLVFDYDPKISRFVEVYVTGCDSSTRWDVIANCPE